MAVGFINHLGEQGEAFYNAVHQHLGLDMRLGTGEWPEGLISHTAGTTEEGFVVTEVWETKEAQEHFRTTRLAPAVAAVGFRAPSHLVWFEVVAHQRRA